MSDDWNLHDAVEDGIRDNAGHLALAGALFAHSQRKQQLQSLEASRQHQAQIAKTEAQRLEIEKQRLELEKLKQQAEKDEKEAVRLLRVMMAEVGAEFDGLSGRGQFKGSPQGVRRDYAMAVLLSKLELIRSRSSSLSDLNDLKELSRLENLAQDLVIKHFAGRDPLWVARSKWHEIEAWMQAGDQLEREVKQACGVVPDPTAVQLPSKEGLAKRHRQLQDFLKQLPSRLEAQADHLPADAAADGRVYPELVEQAQLEDLRDGKQASRANAFDNRWRMVAKVKRPLEPGMLVTNDRLPELVEAVQAALTQLGEWQPRELAHRTELQALAAALEEGRLEDAEDCVKKLGNLTFSGLNYQPVERLKALKKDLDALAAARRGKASLLNNAIRAKYPKAVSQSTLAKLLSTHQARAKSEKIKAAAICVVLLGFTGAGAKLVINNQREQQRLTAETRAKAEPIRREITSKMRNAALGGTLEIPCSQVLFHTYLFVPSASFLMKGRSVNSGQSTEQAPVARHVTLSQPFWLEKSTVTQAQWVEVMGTNPSYTKGANLPVVNVSWTDAQAYVAKLNEKHLLPEGWKFAMPTEAQWEYANRGPYSGTIQPAAWGVQDMRGNIYEWCADWYEDSLKGGIDPSGPTSGECRVYRGAKRGCSYPDDRRSDLGFRTAIVRDQ